ncbi:dihydrolipoyl dehydrogenase [Planctomycetota bacterium]|nr:dihydrolipoyl dehydrogenase [Planctomycetota bacterium]
MPTYDLLIIGAGPGGYVCAIRAAQLGMSVAIVERRADAGKVRLGGTCLNIGCIPSKALLDSSERFYEAKNHFAEHGIAASPTIDLKTMLARKDKVVASLVSGVDFLMKKNKIAVLVGTGKLLAGAAGDALSRVAVTDLAGTTTEHQAKRIVLAMGSTPIELPTLPFDGKQVVSSDQAIAFPEVPKRLAIVGGGVIGLELGSVWARLGSTVTVVEFLPEVCPFLDADVAKELRKVLGKLGITFRLSTKVGGLRKSDDGVVLSATDAAGAAVEITADRVLVAVGRKPVIDSAGLAEAGVALTERKRVAVNQHFQTNLPGVYAIGDLIDGPMLAHKAEEEGVALAEHLAGHAITIDHHLIPNIVYTWPEVASVGITEAEAKAKGIAITVGKYPFSSLGRAKASGDTDGFVKILADAATDRVLGAAIIGPRASDLLAEITAVMAFGGASEDIARTCHGHPTFGEAVKEAALGCLGRIING